MKGKSMKTSDPLFDSGIKKSTQGTMKTFGDNATHTKREAISGLGGKMGRNGGRKINAPSTPPKSREKKDNTDEISIVTKLFKTMKPVGMVTRKDLELNRGKPGMRLNESTTYKINKLLEEFNESRGKYSQGSTIKPTKTTNIEGLTHSKYVSDMTRRMNTIATAKMENSIKQQKISSKITPGTEMTTRENTIGITQPATNNNAEAAHTRAEGYERYSRLKEQEMEKQEAKNG
jgi:hypothetical protein